MKWPASTNVSGTLRTLRRGLRLASAVAKAQLAPMPAPAVRETALRTYTEFGDNPGGLRMLAHVPDGVTGRALVVLLHGCGQDAAAFAASSGWIGLADRAKFTLILPEQTDTNNAGRCFQWFQPADTTRDNGEAGSIAAMTRAAITYFGSDPKLVFIVGLSAGAAMAVAMLAAYPDLFAAGASVAGLPVGAATSGMQAILRMASAGRDLDPAALAARVRAAAPAGFAGPWPRLSVWQGQADTTVAPENAGQLVTQWRALHALPDSTMTQDIQGGATHRSWANTVELWSLPGLPHGYPAGPAPSRPAPFILPSPVDATVAIGTFLGLI